MRFLSRATDGFVLQDIELVDLRLSGNFYFFMICALNVVQTIVIIMLSTPLFGVVVVPIALVYIFILRYFIDTSRQLQRLSSVTRSPIYSHFSESLQGVSSIRSYNAVQRFCDLNVNKVDTHIKCKYSSLMANRWLSVRLEIIGNFVVLFAALFAVLAKIEGTATAGTIGLSVSYSLNVSSMTVKNDNHNFFNDHVNISFLTSLISTTSIIHSQQNKTLHYHHFIWDLFKAPWYLESSNQLHPKCWPFAGEIEFQNYSARYRPGLDLALRNINVTINAREKVGIVGRTGAGKSSMTLALFRIIEADKGSIRIDGLDIASVGLHQLRSNITIIPQVRYTLHLAQNYVHSLVNSA
ncbi:unnamed protein product [Anisakis simplex]|uniref:ABC transmembrane type-1 domain-containing protein n=1 Tax=Anisakis simplex TaxID=6269 RepID=A0A0M3KDA2_ANISI|nr:unnamed protein product [Anisakis simplex]